MANATPKAFRHVWRYCLCSTYDVAKFRGASPYLGDLPHCFIQRRDLVVASRSRVCPSVFNGDLLREQWHKNLKNHDDNQHLRLEHIRSPEPQKITVEDVRKMLSFVRLEALKKGIRQFPKDCISYKELLQVCMESLEQCSEEEAVAFVKRLDESGHILVSGHTVHLRPHKVARALEEAMQLSLLPKEVLHIEELANLEKQKFEIDHEAEKRAKTELWWGLCFFAIKTALLMRWTFWELSWDVMEPVCFFLTSVYFMAGYAFFLRTSTAPTFEGFFKSRFRTKQKQLMKKRNFDHERFRYLHIVYTSRFKPVN
ncbi:hypothetical protein KI387_026466 [Taxus chinensis]|uniref:Calcium uniporter protein C-terminal domain-containing protein n=1 Tax=Taxus chinensis TaxID=29808 RepID=A0AA38FVT7_TAXCH|nr:hypothetical protein KI387_026466 [Taxus chinensis]